MVKGSSPYVAVIGVAFVITFLAELPDKSMFASLVLGPRYRPSWVWAGAAVAFAVHMALAVTAGQLLALLPRTAVQGVVAGLFLAGSAYLWVTSMRPGQEDGADAARQGGRPASFLRVTGMSFGVVFLAEWGTSPRSPQPTWPPAMTRWRSSPGPSVGDRRRGQPRGQEPRPDSDVLDPPGHRGHPARLRHLHHRGRRGWITASAAALPLAVGLAGEPCG